MPAADHLTQAMIGALCILTASPAAYAQREIGYLTSRGAIIDLAGTRWTFEPAVNSNGVIVTCTHEGETTRHRQDFGGRIGPVIDLVACSAVNPQGRRAFIALAMVIQAQDQAPEYRMGWIAFPYRVHEPDTWAVTRVLHTAPDGAAPAQINLVMPGGDSVMMNIVQLTRLGGGEDRLEVHSFIHHCVLANPDTNEVINLGWKSDHRSWTVGYPPRDPKDPLKP